MFILPLIKINGAVCGESGEDFDDVTCRHPVSVCLRKLNTIEVGKSSYSKASRLSKNTWFLGGIKSFGKHKPRFSRVAEELWKFSAERESRLRVVILNLSVPCTFFFRCFGVFSASAFGFFVPRQNKYVFGGKVRHSRRLSFDDRRTRPNSYPPYFSIKLSNALTCLSKVHSFLFARP